MTILCLPARELPLSGESLRSYVRRSAVAMGYDRLRQLLSLLEEVDLPPHLDHLRDGTSLAALASLLGQDVKVLAGLTVHRFAGELMLRAPVAQIPAHCDFKTILRFFTNAQARVCPQCLRDNPAYERLLWSFRPLIGCPQHGILWLDRCPGCQHRLSSQRLDIARCRCGFHFADATPIPVNSAIVDMSQRLVSGFMIRQVWPSGFSTPAGFWWLKRLAAAIRKTTSWLSMTRAKFHLSLELSDEAVAWVASMELLLAWPEGMVDFLDAYQVVDKHRSTSTGVSRSFGLLLREADRLESFGYPAPADALRDYLLERYTRGHLTRKVILFRAPRFQQSLAERPWLTQTEAAQLLNVSQGKINSLLRQQLLAGQIRPAGKRGRTIGLIARESVLLLKAKLAVGLSVREVAQQLGVDRHRIAEMIRAHLFASAMQIGQFWLISPENVADWLSWMKALAPLPQDHSGWISARDAVRRFGPSGAKWVRLIQWMRGGQLPARRASGVPTLRDLYVAIGELQQRCLIFQAEYASQAGYTLQRLGRVLVPGQPVKEVVLRKWIGAGLLRAERCGKAWRIEPEEVERFRSTYCLAPEACALLGVSRSTLQRWELRNLIRPIYSRESNAGAGASVYRRHDVENLRVKQIT